MHVGLHASPRCLPRLGDAIASNGIGQTAPTSPGRCRARAPSARPRLETRDPTPRLLPTSAYGTVRHMSRAVKVLHEKVRTAEGIVVEFKVWRVTDIRRYPEAFRYSFFAARDGVR